MDFRVIGIAGPARVGKDTAADHMLAHRPAYQKVSFADPMKNMLRVGLNMTDGQLWGNHKENFDVRYSCSPRHMMQTLGTEWGRAQIGDNIWVNAMEAHLDQVGGTFILPDVRFENEADFVRKNGFLLHIEGRDVDIGTSHVSEDGVTFKSGDFLVYNNNDGDLEAYKYQVHCKLVEMEKLWS